MSKNWNVAILGATGSVGRALFEMLVERQFPIGELFALARTESAGECMRFASKTVLVQDATCFNWKQAELVFFVAGQKASAAYADKATNAGCLVIDLSGLFSLEPSIPLVLPDVNPFVLVNYRNRNLIAVPHSLTSQLLTALKPLIDYSGLSFINVTSLLSTSAHGKRAIHALAMQSMKLLNGIPIEKNDFFCHQLAFNMLPILPDREGDVHEEKRIINESRKILQNDDLRISARCVQAPVFYGHAQMINFEALQPLTVEEVRATFTRIKDISLSEENDFPTQVGDTTGNAKLSVGCVRKDYGIPSQLQFWSVADNIRFGGALIAIKIAEKLVQEYLD